jgi:gas vesicle protein
MFRFILGLGLGYGIGLVIAPASGEQTRRRLVEQGEEKLADVVQMGRERAGEMGREASQKAFDEAAKRTVGEDVVDRSREA